MHTNQLLDDSKISCPLYATIQKEQILVLLQVKKKISVFVNFLYQKVCFHLYHIYAIYLYYLTDTDIQYCIWDIQKKRKKIRITMCESLAIYGRLKISFILWKTNLWVFFVFVFLVVVVRLQYELFYFYLLFVLFLPQKQESK